MKRTILSLIISCFFCACSVLDTEKSDAENIQSSLFKVSSLEDSTYLESSLLFQRQFQQNLAETQASEFISGKESSSLKDQLMQQNSAILGAALNINHYAKDLMQGLVTNLQEVNSTTPVAVVSFVMLDSDFNQSNLLGNQIAESLIHEIHKFGIPVIDYKTTGFIRITARGDFAFSKDHAELGERLVANYIVGGTMTKHKNGYLVNARIVDLKSKAVVATAQNFIPNEIADALIAKNSETARLASPPPNLKKETVLEESNKPLNNTQKISLIGK